MRRPRFQVYPDKSGQFRWRLLAPNNRTIADSAESYTRRGDCWRSVQRVCDFTMDGYWEGFDS